MSLMETLGKVAIGIAVAKGIGKMMGGGGRSGDGLVDLLDDLIDDNINDNGVGGLGGILDSLDTNTNASYNADGGLGDLLNASLYNEITMETSAEQEAKVEILLKAMIYAVNIDDHLDDTKKSRILEDLGDETSFVEIELMTPCDIEDFIGSVPIGMEQQVYMMSLFVIDLDSNAEAYYLERLSEGLNISPQDCNAIHDKLGAPYA